MKRIGYRIKMTISLKVYKISDGGILLNILQIQYKDIILDMTDRCHIYMI